MNYHHNALSVLGICCLKMRLYNTMLNYKNVSKCTMGLRDKVALVHAVIFIIFIAHVACMPKTKKTLKVLNKCNARPHVDSIFKKYKLPETEYVPSFKPKTTSDLDNFDRTYSLKEPSKRSQDLLKQTRSKRKRKPFNNNRRKVENSIDFSPQYPSISNCGDFPHFPEVEYPLSAREIWKPIYWNDLFPPVDNGQTDVFNAATKPYKKNSKNKNKIDIKNCFKSKTVPYQTKVQNSTDVGMCAKDMNTIIMTTSVPSANNFVMKDKDSIPVKTENDTINTDRSDYKQTNNSIFISKIPNTTAIADFCANDNNNNFGHESSENNIGIDEEFTTDEPDFAFALSTPPPPNTKDMQWTESKTIESDKSLYPDELDDYFIAVRN